MRITSVTADSFSVRGVELTPAEELISTMWNTLTSEPGMTEARVLRIVQDVIEDTPNKDEVLPDWPRLLLWLRSDVDFQWCPGFDREGATEPAPQFIRMVFSDGKARGWVTVKPVVVPSK